MKEPLVGVLGCGGAVGSVACDILQQSYRILGGQRHKPAKLPGKYAFEGMELDLYNSESLAHFCSECDIVLNCAGPSYRIGKRVALAATEANSYYVDVFGEDSLEQSLLVNKDDIDGLFVIAAGVFPGLSAVLPLWLFSQGFETVDSIHTYAGGREHCSFGAGADILLSSVADYGIPNAYWKNGSVTRFSEPSSNATYLPGFKGKVYAQHFLSNETVRLAKQLKLHEAHWHSVNADKQVMDTISKCCSRLSINASDKVLEESVTELVTAASMALSGREPWYTMMIELQGTNQGETKRKRAILRSSNSYQLSGVVAAVTVQTILQQRPADGVYRAFELLDPSEVIEKILETKATDSLYVVDIQPVNSNNIPRQPEEGVL